MRIWFVNQYAIPPSEPGGTRHHTLAVKLAERGHECAVIASSFSHVLRSERHLDEGKRSAVDIYDGVEWVWLRSPAYAGNSAARAWNMAVFGYRVWRDPLLRELPPPDAIVGSTPPLPAAYGAMLLSRARHCSFVAEIRDLWPQALEELGGYGRSHPVMVLLRAVERSLYKNAARVVTLLPNSTSYLVERGARRELVSWMPNGIDLGQIPPVRSLPGGRPFTVTYAGTHGFANGLDLVLDAATQLRDLDVLFRLVGDGPDKDRLRERADREGIANVRFDEAVPKAEIHSVLSRSDAFILPLNRADVFSFGLSPNKLFDYLAAGRPVILATDGDFGDLPVRDIGLLASPPTGSSIAGAVRQLFSLPEGERREMGAAGRRYIESSPDLGDIAVELESLLASAVRERPG